MIKCDKERRINLDTSTATSEYTKYFIIGGNGFVVGVRDDAPDVVKVRCDELLRNHRNFQPGD